ncbi:transposase family protein [Pseudoalteromonas piscicida]|uniref:transposase family protein n=1 Tax=Pseudoalteromonas piscicida TaxID=43662 RepID=UPI0032C1A2A0
MRTVSLHAGLHLTLDNADYLIDRIVDDKCYLVALKDGSLLIESKYALRDMHSNGRVILHGTQRKQTTKKSADLSTLSDEQKAQLEIRLVYLQSVVRWLGSKPTTKGIEDVVDCIHSELKGAKPSASTVYRWWRKWESSSHDPMSLVNKKSGSSTSRKFSRHVIQAFNEVVEEIYLNRQCRPKSEVYDAFLIRLNKMKVTGPYEVEICIPSRAQFYRMFNSLDKFDEMAARKGKYAAEKHFRIAGAGPVVTRILERVEVDHTPLDVFAVDGQAKTVVGRPTFTVLLDYFSKMILGFYVSLEPPSEISVMHALKNAVFTKDYCNEMSRVKERWESFGVPHTLICDNGLEFHSGNLRRVCKELMINLQFCPKKQPHYKGAVERFIKTMNLSTSHNFPGTTRSNANDRGDYQSMEEAIFTLNDINNHIHEWIINVYQNRVHRATHRTPVGLWLEGLGVVEPLLPESKEQFDIALCKEATRTLSHKGVEINNLLYNSTELGLLRHKNRVESVSVRFDPMNMGHIWVLNETESPPYFFKVSCTKSDYADGLTKRTHKAIIAEQKTKGIKDFSQQKLLEYKHEFMEQVTKDVKGKSYRKRVKAARYSISKDNIQSEPLSKRFSSGENNSLTNDGALYRFKVEGADDE